MQHVVFIEPLPLSLSFAHLVLHNLENSVLYCCYQGKLFLLKGLLGLGQSLVQVFDLAVGYYCLVVEYPDFFVFFGCPIPKVCLCRFSLISFSQEMLRHEFEV